MILRKSRKATVVRRTRGQREAMDYSNVVPGLFRDTQMRLIRDLTFAHSVGLAPAAVDLIQGLNFMVAG